MPMVEADSGVWYATTMLDRLFALFGGSPSTDPGGKSPSHRLHRAAAVLLTIAARLDGHVHNAEQSAIRRALRGHFRLSADEVEALLEDSAAEANEATDVFSLTREINRHIPFDERPAIIEMLWEVAYADGTLHHYEANLVRRVAGLLHVSDQDSGKARKRVLERLGSGGA